MENVERQDGHIFQAQSSSQFVSCCCFLASRLKNFVTALAPKIPAFSGENNPV